MTKFDFPGDLCKVFGASMRNIFAMGILTLLAAGILALSPAAAAAPDPGQIATSVGRWLEQAHYTRQKLDDAMSQKLLMWTNFKKNMGTASTTI
jgi:hypothetical protein